MESSEFDDLLADLGSPRDDLDVCEEAVVVEEAEGPRDAEDTDAVEVPVSDEASSSPRIKRSLGATWKEMSEPPAKTLRKVDASDMLPAFAMRAHRFREVDSDLTKAVWH